MPENKTNYSIAKALSALFLLFIVTSFLDRNIQEGMFFDGVTYASISRNLAIGKGSFWHLHFRGVGQFTGQLPLMFWLESLLFRLFGDHFFTEKIFCFLVWGATILLMSTLWRSISSRAEHRQAFAFMMLGWWIISAVMWAYPNNLLDNMMAVFDLAAVLVLYRAYSKGTGVYVAAFIAGLLVFGAVFTKGPVGLFPVSLPLIYCVVYRTRIVDAIASILVMLMVIGLSSYILLAFPGAEHSIYLYINEQILASVKGDTDITGGDLGRWAVITELLFQLLSPVLLALLVVILAKVVKKQWVLPEEKKPIWFFLLLGVCASVPMVFSAKVRAFYFIPCFPYYATGLALIALPAYVCLIKDIKLTTQKVTVLRTTLLLLCLGATVYLATRVGKIGRDVELVTDIKKLRKYVPAGQTLIICPGLEADYSFLSYMQRYNRMNVTTELAGNNNYVLSDKSYCDEQFRKQLDSLGYQQQSIQFDRFILFRHR